LRVPLLAATEDAPKMTEVRVARFGITLDPAGDSMAVEGQLVHICARGSLAHIQKQHLAIDGGALQRFALGEVASFILQCTFCAGSPAPANARERC
jgi:hypothetical protein